MKFIKTTSEELTGLEKTAILLSEIGPMYNSNYDALMDSLHLSADEKKKILKAMQNLGNYHPARKDFENGMAEIKREEAVLNEVIAYGKRKGIFHPVEKTYSNGKYVRKNIPGGIAEIAEKDPKILAAVLSSWIKEE